ncbi:sterile alpha motif domain-containing protein 15 [Nilaparvata lugens]|uniref:sterile alpha motif domain-containing protein 15 n=1 Tax=Nilaparvata lugens TaxID=108931 RepID=UPI00193DE9D3|nr:sterile alpha motif domain-containing protein 15 [Nilaparvata lugens]
MSSHQTEKRFFRKTNPSNMSLIGVRLPSFLRRANTYGPEIKFNLSGKKDPELALEPYEELDKYDFTIPEEMEWSVGDVVNWIEHVVGLPQYKEAFFNNCIDGRKLVRLKPGNFPKMNIKNFEHIKQILRYQRELFEVREERYNDSIAFPSRKVVRRRYLELKSKVINSRLTPQQFLMDENLIHECWDRQTEEKDYPLLRYGRLDVPLDKLRCYILNMDLIKQSEELPVL